ncbi:hypothetical protein HQN90_21355 [Paenibacillus alba]|nr:hypothetical protein [Paenibacillus alba]
MIQQIQSNTTVPVSMSNLNMQYSLENRNTINRGKHKMADKKLGFAEVTTNARNA